jgi:type II secretory pathway pseudopilin PulG
MDKQKRIRCRGFLLAEVIVATALLGLIIAGLAVSMNGFSMFNDCQWARQRCAAAAEGQLDSLAATGRLIEPQEIKRLWPGVEVTVDKSAGVTPWDGLELIQVTATAQAGPRRITVHLARYFRHESAAAEGGQS